MLNFIKIRFLHICFYVHLCLCQIHADIEYNTINEDGSFRFRHTNDDIGGYYHSATGTPDKIVRGRYGSRNPATGQVDETVYTAGPRGFRANGPKIHRKMDLAQFPVLPRGSPDDPLADPFDDPSYSFSYRAPDHSRSEDNDATGRVRGLYSYIDDVGERHSVRYAAGAGTGFEVSNAVPDNPVNVGYSNPLYKAHPTTRGKMAVQRGPGGSYKLIAAGPDHRRAESRAPDGLVRGTYSFLDDKGIQRTVEYVAGAGIGYRVVQNRVGPGTHINPSVADFRLTDADFRLANDFGRGAGGGLTGGGGVGGGGGSRGGGSGGGSGGGLSGGASGPSGGGSGPSGGGRDGEYLQTADTETGGDGSGTEIVGEDDSLTHQDDNSLSTGSGSSKADRVGTAAVNRGSTSYRDRTTISGSGSGGGSGGSTSGDGGRIKVSGDGRSRGGSGGGGGGGGGVSRNGQRRPGNGSGGRRGGGGGGGVSGSSGGSSGGGGGGGGSRGYLYDPPSAGSPNNYDLNDDDVVGSLPPLVTANHRILEIDRERDWVNRHRDSTIIRNVGKWYVGLPPGQSVRAHVQNIDLVPLGGRILSPSEALRQDEIAELAASRER